jgi:VanZ family protein
MISRVLRSAWPSLAWTALIFFLLTINTGSIESVPFMGIKNLDKLAHMVLFFVLAYLWVCRLYGSGDNTWIWVLALCSAYGMGMEFYQEYFTTREFELNDIIADVVGASLGSIIGKKIGPYGNRGRNQN